MTDHRAVTTQVRRTGTPLPPVGRQVLLAGVLYLCAASRWGSHVGVPGVPFYIGDLALLGALAQTVLAVRASALGWRSVGRAVARAHLALLLALTLLGWAALRAVLGVGSFLSHPAVALRDLAPYGYAAAALVSFVLATTDGSRQRRAVYGALTFHLAWLLGAALLPGWPWTSVQVGGAPLLVPRPDFDAAVCGAALALAVHEGLHGPRRRPRWQWAALAGFALVNGYLVTTLLTRAGLLAAFVAVGAVTLTWGLRGLRGRDLIGRRSAAVLLTVGVLAALALVSPPGQRLLDSLGGGQGSAQGTVRARQFTWSGVSEYVLSAPRRTAVGVGFGSDFLTDSGTLVALEGEDYDNVRSPHNYLLGTFARMGVFGAVIAGAMVTAAGLLALGRLTRPTGTVTTFAALVVLVVPVTALLGVVLESPFGAIPYFWAVGHLARQVADPPGAGGGGSVTSPRREPRTTGGSARSRPATPPRPSSRAQ